MPDERVARTAREITHLARSCHDTVGWRMAADELLRDLVAFDSSCWHTMDPGTLLITGHLTLNLPDRFPQLAANEYLSADVNRFADLATAPSHVGLLSEATDGHPDRSMRWREMLHPNGLDAEARVVFVDRGGCWGSVILLRDHGRPDFDEDDVDALSLLGGVLAEGIRHAVLDEQLVDPQPGGPGLVLFDQFGEIDTMTPDARHWIAELGGGPMPPVVFAVGAAAFARGVATARVRTPAGQWLALHGARLDGDDGRTSVIIQPPQPAALVGLLATAYGLTPREREVTGLVLGGRSTQQIARALTISAYTVQEHLGSVFDKVGVRSRSELVGQVFFRHCLPDIT